MYVFIFSAVIGSAFAGYAGSSPNSGNHVGQGGSSSGSSGTGTGYGYSGSFSGTGPPPNFVFPPIPQFDFSEFLNRYFDSFRKYHQEFINNGGAFSYSYTSSSPNSNAVAHSSLTFDDTSRLQANIQSGVNGYGFPGGIPAFASSGGGGGPGYTSFGGGFGGGYSSPGGASFGGSFSGPATGAYGPGGGGASASASIGPQGVHQTAGVYPENPNQPNINTRFGGGGGGGDGSYSVFTSSQSHSSNVGGRPQNFHEAQTTVNDNGKITTYRVKNP